MPIELYRIDDRLIHGQVVVGWGKPLNVGFIVLVDDIMASSEWEQELYRMGVPPEMEIIFLSTSEYPNHAARFAADPRRGILLTGDVETMLRIADSGPAIRAVNVGGLHHREGRIQRLGYVFLTPGEEQDLQALAQKGVTVTAQDLPSTRPVSLADILKA